MYTIDPAMSFGEVILYYEKYLTETKAEGKKVSATLSTPLTPHS